MPWSQASRNKFLDITVVNIQRIQNHALYTQYAGRKKIMEKTNPQINNERRLFYGCAGEMVKQICYQGFNRSYKEVHSKLYFNTRMQITSIIFWQQCHMVMEHTFQSMPIIQLKSDTLLQIMMATGSCFTLVYLLGSTHRVKRV